MKYLILQLLDNIYCANNKPVVYSAYVIASRKIYIHTMADTIR